MAVLIVVVGITLLVLLQHSHYLSQHSNRTESIQTKEARISQRNSVVIAITIAKTTKRASLNTTY